MSCTSTFFLCHWKWLRGVFNCVLRPQTYFVRTIINHILTSFIFIESKSLILQTIALLFIAVPFYSLCCCWYNFPKDFFSKLFLSSKFTKLFHFNLGILISKVIHSCISGIQYFNTYFSVNFPSPLSPFILPPP